MANPIATISITYALQGTSIPQPFTATGNFEDDRAEFTGGITCYLEAPDGSIYQNSEDVNVNPDSTWSADFPSMAPAANLILVAEITGSGGSQGMNEQSNVSVQASPQPDPMPGPPPPPPLTMDPPPPPQMLELVDEKGKKRKMKKFAICGKHPEHVHGISCYALIYDSTGKFLKTSVAGAMASVGNNPDRDPSAQEASCDWDGAVHIDPSLLKDAVVVLVANAFNRRGCTVAHLRRTARLK